MKLLALTCLGMGVGLGLMAAAPASAQTVADFTAAASVNPSPPPATVGGASGTYRVILTRVGSSFQLEIRGNNDGNPPTGAEGDPSPPASPVPKSGVGTITVTFGLKAGGAAQASAASGATDNYTPGVGVGSNLGGPNNDAFGGAGAAWAAAGGSTLRFFAPAEAAYIAPRGGNRFLGTFNLNKSLSDIGTVQVSLQNGTQQWSGRVVLAPEPGSLALALPGLLPLGLVLMRRRAGSEPPKEDSEPAV